MIRRCLVFALSWALLWAAAGQVPNLVNYQGRLVVGSAAFDGPGRFKLALVNSDGSQVYWRSAPDANKDGEPDNSILVRVNRGLYSVALGDTTLANMEALPPEVFLNSAVYLRAWFNDGTNGFQQLVPDQRITTVGYAMVAGTLADGAITAAKLAPALTTQILTLSNRIAAIEAAAGAGQTLVSSEPRDTNLISKGYLTFSTVPAPGWVQGAIAEAPSPRSDHTAVWTGQEMIVWGGALAPGAYTDAGTSYHADLDSWTAISPISAPPARGRHTAVWTGSEMIVWGGFSAGGYLNSGARLNPVLQIWKPLPDPGAPTGRVGHSAVWTGRRMVIWGGRDGGRLLNDGAVYNPASDQWANLNVPGSPAARANATTVWTGSRLLVWGGEGAADALASGSQLSFGPSGEPAGWTALSTQNAPSARSGHTAVWAGEKMILWGGQRQGALLGDGAAYDPESDQWEALPTDDAPSPRSGHAAAWTGQEMIVFGGETASGAVASGAAYNPSARRWRVLNSAGGPFARTGATVVWSGTELLVFGGQINGQPLAALQRLSPQPTWYFYRKP